MWIVHVILILILITASIVFVSLNGGRVIDVISLGFADYQNVSLNIVVLESALIGAFWALMVSFFIQISSRVKIMRLKKINVHLRDELDNLRILPLEDLPISEEER
jgi:hypothetical protein